MIFFHSRSRRFSERSNCNINSYWTYCLAIWESLWKCLGGNLLFDLQYCRPISKNNVMAVPYLSQSVKRNFSVTHKPRNLSVCFFWCDNKALSFVQEIATLLHLIFAIHSSVCTTAIIANFVCKCLHLLSPFD